MRFSKNTGTHGNLSRFLAVSLTFISAFVAVGQSVSAETESKVKIGVLLPLTGAFARYGQKIQEAISHFSDEKVQFLFEDEGCDPKMAVTAYTKLTNFDKVNLFLGPWCGSPQSAVAPRLKSSDQLVVLGSSAPEIVYNLSAGRMLSTQHSIEEESTFLAKQVARLGAKNVAIVFRENQFSRAHEAAFRKAFSGSVLETFAYNSEDLSELKSIALRVKKLNPDALYVPDASPLMAGLLHEMSTMGLRNIKVYSVYSAQSDDVLKVVGTAGEGMIYSYPDIGKEEALHVFPTLAAKILVEGVKQCGDKVACIREVLMKNNHFDTHGVLSGKLILKTIRDGKFVEAPL